MATVAELLFERGRREGDSRRQAGAASAGMWRSLSDIIGQTGAQIGQEIQQAPIRAQEQEARDLQLQGLKDERAAGEAAAAESAALKELFASGNVTEDAVFGLIGPERGAKLLTGLSALTDTKRQQFKSTQEILAATLAGMDALPEDLRAEVFPDVRKNLISRGVITEQDAPETYDPAWFAQARGFGQAAPKPEEGFTLSPGQKRFGPKGGEAIASVAPEEKPETRSLQVQANEALKRGDTTEYQRIRKVIKETSESGRAPTVNISTGDPGTVAPPADPGTQDLLSQAGLSYNGFLVLTGRMSQLARDKVTRERASREAAEWARSRGMDVSTMASQYKAYNEALEGNIQRYNRTQLAEGEIAADVSNLLDAVKTSGLGDVRAINAAKQWLKGELNDPNAAQYVFFLNQLTNDIALYNAASQGRAALEADLEEAKAVVRRGISTGSLQGMQKAITQSVEKMGTVLEASIDRAQQNVWKLFGVGDKYKPKGKTGGEDNRAADLVFDPATGTFKKRGGG